VVVLIRLGVRHVAAGDEQT